MSIHKKLMQARMALHGREIKKSGRNTFANYSYMELADFLIPTQQIFSELGLCGIVSFTADTASLSIYDTDSADIPPLVITSPMGSAALKGCHEVQNIGAVETYQRRYLWVTAMEIVEHDALDAGGPADTKRPPAQVGQPGAITGVKAAVLHASGDLGDMSAVDRIAQTILANFTKDGPKKTAALLAGENFGSDELLYLSTKLPSAMNNAIKKAQAELRAEQEPA